MKRVRGSIVLSFVALLGLAAGPVVAQKPDDILEQAKQRQQVEAQRVELAVRAADKNATLVGRTDPGRAVELLKNAQLLLDNDTALSATRKASLKRMVEISLRAFQGRASDRNPGTGPAGTYARRQQDERDRQDADQIARTMADINRLQAGGHSVEANRLQDDLRRRYPNNPVVSVGSTIAARNDLLARGRDFRDQRSTGFLGVRDSIDKSNLPETREYVLPANWAEKSKKRSPAMQLTAAERAVLKALNTPVTVDFDDKATFEGVLNYLSKEMNLPNMMPPKVILDEAMVTADTPVKLKADRVSLRTVLKRVLGEVGLTYIIKDGAIQVLTQAQARETLTTRTYYIGDLVQVVDIQSGPIVNQFQMIANVNRIMAMIVQSVDPNSWEANNGPGKIAFDPITMSIIVRQTAEVHMMLGVGLR